MDPSISIANRYGKLNKWNCGIGKLLCTPAISKRRFSNSKSPLTKEKEKEKERKRMVAAKRRKILRKPSRFSDIFNELPEDLVLYIFIMLSSSVSFPSDIISIRLTCKRLNILAANPLVLSKAGYKAFAVRAKKWCESAHRFFKQCVFAGNFEACYGLGMIRFYCLRNREIGASLMTMAAVKFHTRALYSLAIIQFNGSGGNRCDKNLRTGVALCSRSASLGHVDAIREIGHCLQDGYGIRKNVSLGRQLLNEANARELFSVIRPYLKRWRPDLSGDYPYMTPPPCPLDDYVWRMPAPEVHPANQFLTEWFGSGRGLLGTDLKLCGNRGCGRPEIRPHEFRRCSLCATEHYCSRGCQSLDWRLRHNVECEGFQLRAEQPGMLAMEGR